MDHKFHVSFTLYDEHGERHHFAVGSDDPAEHLELLRTYRKMLANAGYTATPGGLEPGEEAATINAYVAGETSNGDPCVYLYADNPALQYRVSTVYVEKFDELPFPVDASRVWPGAAPTREMAEQKGYMRHVQPVRIVLAPTGKQTESGRPIMRFARVLGSTGKLQDEQLPESLDDVAELSFDEPKPVIETPDYERLYRRFHALGEAVYGAEWDAKRPELVKAVSKRRTRSSKELTTDEISRLIQGMEEILQQRQPA